ncbi:MAG TPA: adenylosuccinate lyase [Phycisphaerae bacterium]|nr:adenylosuccinate lyase [Phycisphaerae bacterium]HRR83896.1 adenylosuccinate lyase [Phycisphaerae bacterium]
MNSNKDTYENPLVSRNASPEMCRLFSPRHRILTWRRIWLAVAEAQAQLGLPVSRRQIAELRRTMEDIDWDRAAEHEKKLRHDVMAHLYAWGDVAPKARGILHLGMTSMDVVDNADLLIMREAMVLIRDWLVNAIDALGAFARKWRNLPCLGFTHYQPAQLTTVGRRACLWAYDFVRDLEELEDRLGRLRFRGIRGATGTQASFLSLFDGNAAKVVRLEKIVTRKLGFEDVEPVTGQTYSRKIDAQVVATLAGIAASAHKFANDIRLLAGMKEIEEPFEKSQVGSSAMAYKRNPMRCERMTGLARYVISVMSSPLQTAAEQWLERTLDDSSNKRLSIPESFLAVDGILRLVTDVSRGLVVYPKVIGAHVQAELPFMATEEILMAATAGGQGARGKRARPGDRQALHELIRRHSQAAALEVKMHGRPNDLLQRLQKDPAFANVDFRKALDARRFVGLAPQQVDHFVKTVIGPILRRHSSARNKQVTLNV